MICTYMYETYPLHGPDPICARPGPDANHMFHICMYISSYMIADCLILSYIIPCFAWEVTPYFFLRGTFGGHPKQQICGYPKKKVWGYPEEKVWGYPKL